MLQQDYIMRLIQEFAAALRKFLQKPEGEDKDTMLRDLYRQYVGDYEFYHTAATEDALKAYMTANGTDELYGPSFKITWREVTSSRLDSKALKSAAPELYQRFTKQTTTRRFVVA